MPFFRAIALILPLTLILLLVAGSQDMLGGWNQTNVAMSTVLALFLLCPLVALALLSTEIVSYCKARNRQRTRGFLFMGLALLILVGALAVDLYLLSQLRM